MIITQPDSRTYDRHDRDMMKNVTVVFVMEVSI